MKNNLYLWLLAFIVSGLSLNSSILAQEEIPTMSAGILMGEIELDGRLDEISWQQSTPGSNYIQGKPYEGSKALEETEVHVLIGEKFIYVGAQMYESDPSVIDKNLVRRDTEGQYDFINVAFDPNFDRRTSYYFRVSAANVQFDKYFYNDSQQDRAWNAVWESAVHHHDQGWSVEMKIPLSQLRYDSNEPNQTWGFQSSRRRMVENEWSYFALHSQRRTGYVSQFGILENVRIPESSRRIETRPYVSNSLHKAHAEEGNPFFDGSENTERIGADLKLGLGSAFTVDATINPDFGQIEADPAEINLSEFETRFDERRPFFVEDAQVFDFPLSRSPGDKLYYSRRIGRVPHGSAPSGADFSRIPLDATIDGAMKLTGKTDSGLSIGLLAASVGEETGKAFYTNENRFEEFRAEPRSQFGALKIQRDLKGGASQIGALFTGVNRDLSKDDTFDFLPKDALTGGLHFQHQWNDRDWSIEGSIAASQVRGSENAITRVQTSSNHYFQRPDATRLAVDSTATSMNGGRWQLALNRQNGEHFTGGFWLGELSPGFEVNDLGYSRAREKISGGTRLNYKEIFPSSWYKSYNIGFWAASSWSHEALDNYSSWDSWEASRASGTTNLSFKSTFINEWKSEVNFTYSSDHRNFALTRGGPVMEDPGSFNVRGNVSTDARKTLFLKSGFSRRSGRKDSGDQLKFYGTVRIRPSPQFEMSVEPSVTSETMAQQYVTSTATLPYTETYGRRYIFADLERHTMEMATRVSWIFSPRISFQFYAQPFMSSADYTRYKQLESPRTYDFTYFEEGTLVNSSQSLTCQNGSLCRDETTGTVRNHVDFNNDNVVDYAFTDRDINLTSLIGNAVFRWEYKPGSTLFLVWQRKKTSYLALGNFNFDRNFESLLNSTPDDRIIVKLNYWLGI
tara:strand:- start:20715 stop:23441 length:2727 start_codon:yes stop_codon:yes gene_type:complete